MPRLFHIHTSQGRLELYAITAAQACSAAMELLPGCRVLRICRQGEW